MSSEEDASSNLRISLRTNIWEYKIKAKGEDFDDDDDDDVYCPSNTTRSPTGS